MHRLLASPRVFLVFVATLLFAWYRLKRKEDYVEKFHLLFEHGDCSKLFLGGRGGVATAGMVCAFTPAGVMVAWKVLPTPESVYDVVDFMRWMKVSKLLAFPFPLRRLKSLGMLLLFRCAFTHGA